ncbi:Protein stoned-B like protein [Argiope bruennichi]|uniref:Protein stoned-B like protein n=1 Tax=Argiope bruennichi TaxID=94029 RepID=A0A8T0FGZ9_ARGBR|nr:Protein stoned-B like protein [Argiope bruennichi]
MNFIKKKLKGHKKDDEEEEYEKAVYEQSLHPQNQDQKMKNTEEWQFFQQLSMKVQDTVQKTQTTLNKLKDARPEDGLDEDRDYDVDSDLLSKETPPYPGTTKVLRAPPRPPPPAGDKPSMPVDLDFGSDFSQSSISKGPPRPPPPGSSETFTSDSSALHGTPSKSYGSPARPPPPNIGKTEPLATDSTFPGSNQMQNNASFSLLDEFGFKSEPVTTTNTNVQDLLFLDDKEDVDPFDTSFVDVRNIAPLSASSEKNENATQEKVSEKSFNPFCSSVPSDEWMTGSPNHSDQTKKTATNPFFSGILEDVKPVSQENVQPSSSHNPFSFNEPVSNNNDKDDFFGLTIEQSSSKDKLAESFFQKSDSRKGSAEFENSKNFVNSAFNISETLEAEKIADSVSESQTTISDSTQRKSIPNEVDMWNSGKTDPVQRKSIPNEVDMWDSSKTDSVQRKSIPNDSDMWDSGKAESVQPKSIPNDLWDSNKTDSVQRKSIPNEIDIWDSDKKEDSSILKPDQPSKVIETSETSLVWSSSAVTDVLQPEKSASKEEPATAFESEVESKTTGDLDFFGTNNAAATESFSNLDRPLDNKSYEILQPETSNNLTSFASSKENETEGTKSDAISSSSLKEQSQDKMAEYSDTFDGKYAKAESATKEDIQTTFAEDFSKPFDEENEQNAFLFKVKPTDQKQDLEFDAFAAKFENAKDSQSSDAFDPFMSKKAPTLKKIKENYKGFDSMDEFDPFRVTSKVEDSRSMMKKEPSRDSFEDYDNEVDFSVVIKPKVKDSSEVQPSLMEPPKLLPPPKTPTKAFETPASRFNPFDKDFLDNTEISKATEKTFETVEVEDEPVPALGEAGVRKADSVETPLSPLFDEDTSQPLEVFPKPYDRDGWDMVLRQPNKKKLTGNRFWKKIFVKLSENSVLQLFNKADDKLPFQELPLQPCYSLSEIGAQQYDQYGKIFTVKLQYKFYRERVGVRPGQISKVTQGQVTSMGDVAKLGLPLQHSPQTSQLLKLGSHSYSDVKYFIQEVEDALFRMSVHRDRVLTYKTEEVQVIAQDEFYVEQSKTGHIDKQLARVRIFFLAFITGMPSVEVGLNDIVRQGKEVVGRYDIIPVVTEEWIRLEDCEFHSCVVQDEFYKSRVIKFHPPDACLFELLRFRIRPPKNRELPLQVRVFMTVSNTRVEIRSDILVPGYSSRKQGQVPCENIQIRFPIPECWIYLFRTEKHFRYGSKKSTARRPGKIKGLERIIGAAQNLDPSLIEVSAGQAKYEHVFHAVVWRIPRLPKEGQGAYTQQLFLLRTELTSFDQIPESFEQFVDVEFTMPATYVSHTTVRSVSVTNPVPPEKYVRYISKHEYKVEIDFKNSSDEIEGLISTPSASVPVSTTPAVQESTEDEDKEDDSD